MTTATTAWPTIDELAEVEHAFREAGHKLDVLHLKVYEREQGIVDSVQGRRGLPTLEELGALARFIANLEVELHSMQGHLQQIASAQHTAACTMPMWPEDGDDAS